MAEPEAPQRDRWEEAADEHVRRIMSDTDNNGELGGYEQRQNAQLIAAALRAAFEGGEVSGREEMAVLLQQRLIRGADKMREGFSVWLRTSEPAAQDRLGDAVERAWSRLNGIPCGSGHSNCGTHFREAVRVELERVVRDCARVAAGDPAQHAVCGQAILRWAGLK